MSRRANAPSLRRVPVVEIATRPPHMKRPRGDEQHTNNAPQLPETKRRRRNHSNDSTHAISLQEQSSRMVGASAPPTSRRSVSASSPTVSEFGLFGSDDFVASTTNNEPHIPPSRLSSPSPHDSQDEDFMDEANLVLDDEGINMSGSAESDDEDDVPVRVLQDFFIYDTHTLKPDHISELLQLDDSDRTYSASGAAMAYYIDKDESDDGSPPPPAQLVRLSNILEFSLHYYDADNDSLDSKIYIRTEYAWYILDDPSREYGPYFDSFAMQHHALHLLLDYSLGEVGSTLEDFVQSLSKMPKIPTVGRRLKRSEFESSEIRGYIIYYIPRLDKKLQRLPLVKELVHSMGLALTDVLGAAPRAKKQRPVPRGQPLSETDVLKHRNQTVVTPVVSRIAQNLFRTQLEVAGALAEEEVAHQRLVDTLQEAKMHHSDPENVRWGDRLIPDSELKYYDSLIMDGVKYEIGDVVMVNPGVDENTARARNATADASHSRNTYGNRVWFCRICYFCEKKGKRFFHGQWFLHGSKTILQETAHPRSLYLLMECEDNPVASIFQKCNITMLTPEDAEKADDGDPEADDFHCGLVWDQESTTFHDLPTAQEAADALDCLPSNEPCFACYFKLKQSQQESLQTTRHGFMWTGVPYHRHDFVYLKPANLKHDAVYEVAQIVAIKEDPDAPVVLMRMCGRYRGLHKKRRARNADDTIAYHDRRLYFEPRVTSVPVDRFDGKCFVKHLTRARDIEEWVDHPDHFYLYEEINEDDGVLCDIDAPDFEMCKECMDDEMKKIDRAADFKRSTQPLRGLELFSGAGGLGTGLGLSGYVDTKYAVEFSPSAATTYQHNHPEAIVYCQDSNVLLKHAIDTHEGKQPPALKSNDGKTLCPPMPPKDKVDFIYGGPPCQSFSGANHNRKADDIRSTLPGNMLSYLEFYEADYFMLENVKGLLSYPLMSEQDGLCLEGGIKSGVVKLIMRVLIALRYQVTVKLLQAGHYGAPQGRLRVIFFGAKRGLKLPEFPIPEYAFPGGAHFVNLPTGERLSPATRSKIPGDYHQCAPLPPITINQSIGDLPAFDWVNPHNVIKRKPRDVNEVAIRAQGGIIAFDAVLESSSCAPVSGNARQAMKGLVGFPNPVPYMLPSQNMYQKWMRQASGELVDSQYTKRFGSVVVEATVTLPLRPNATHRDLPVNLRPRMARPGGKQENKVFYGRPDGDGHFKTALTSLTPQLKGIWPIHPNQKRIFTVRECARAQGFPDHYGFQSADAKPQRAVDNQIRQIGNAVPVPLALALGKSIGAALLENWEARKREWSPAV